MNYTDFQTPKKQYYPRPLWFWNDYPTEEALSDILDTAEEKSAYGGFGILPYDACGMEYMGEAYLQAYEFVLKRAKERGLKLCLYDEWWFPSGSAGGLLKKRYPQACAKRLDKYEYPVPSSGHMELFLTEILSEGNSNGTLMAAVAMHTKTREIINLDRYIHDGVLIWDAQTDAQAWNVMLFVCVLSDWDHVNYLDPKAVEKFIAVTHEAYYQRFAAYFGTVIDSAFYDEPQMYAVDGKMWTEDFNERFVHKYGISPEPLYPALWYDIGEKTASVRNMFFSLRAEMYAEGFPKIIQEWCSAHHIRLTGHVDQEEVLNPVGITGDLMQSFRYQDIPGFDEISTPGRARKIYKLVSSAAYNWDKPLVMSECYGAMAESTDIDTMYREAMEQFAKGMNLFVPHAVWLNAQREKVIFAPELSYRNPRYAGVLKPFNTFCARMSYLLQGGRHLAEIAVLYPINGLQTEYHFDWGGDPYLGGPAPAYTDYQEIGDWLSTSVRQDFTYLHPEVLATQCTVESGRLCMHHTVNAETYRVLILPGTNTMRLDNLYMAKAFLEVGGTVIATSCLPSHAAEPDRDAELKQLLADMFDLHTDAAYSVKTNAAKGRAYFLPHPTAQLLRAVLADAHIAFDISLSVAEDGEIPVYYIRKEKDSCDIIYLANCSAKTTDIEVNLACPALRRYEVWNPHTGLRTLPAQKEANSAVQTNRQCFVLHLEANQSLVLISD